MQKKNDIYCEQFDFMAYFCIGKIGYPQWVGIFIYVYSFWVSVIVLFKTRSVPKTQMNAHTHSGITNTTHTK